MSIQRCTYRISDLVKCLQTGLRFALFLGLLTRLLLQPCQSVSMWTCCLSQVSPLTARFSLYRSRSSSPAATLSIFNTDSVLQPQFSNTQYLIMIFNIDQYTNNFNVTASNFKHWGTLHCIIFIYCCQIKFTWKHLIFCQLLFSSCLALCLKSFLVR